MYGKGWTVSKERAGADGPQALLAFLFLIVQSSELPGPQPRFTHPSKIIYVHV